jgi:site-specific recombinase XerD
MKHSKNELLLGEGSVSTLMKIDSPYIQAATSDNTRKAYRSDIRHFERSGGLLPATSAQVINYLHHYAVSLNPRTLERRLTALKQWHRYQGFADPTIDAAVQKTLIGIKRLHGKPKQKAFALSVQDIEAMTAPLLTSHHLSCVRDHALIKIGYYAALRRSELVGLQVNDFLWQEEGVTVLLNSSKTDQEHEGQSVMVPYGDDEHCPLVALKRWLTLSAIASGFVFCCIKKGGKLTSLQLHPASFNEILKKHAAKTLHPHQQKISSHSLRRGITTAASLANADFVMLMRHGRWKSEKTVLEYIESAKAITHNVANLVMKKKNNL